MMNTRPDETDASVHAQTPAASQASGAPNVRVPTLGARAHGHHRVSADVILLDGQSYLPGNSGTMTSFY